MVRLILLARIAFWVQGAIAAALFDDTIRCGDDSASDEFLAQAKALQNGIRPHGLEAEFGGVTISVDTYFHVVTSAAKNGSVTIGQLNSQLGVLNRSYNPYGITFNLISTDFTVNDNWATGNYDSAMKPALRKGTYEDLNVYFLTDLQPAGLLGICPFPAAQSGPGDPTFDLDGCKILATTVPGGSRVNYNQGATATHEIGHWFGLFHVFQGQVCYGDGDFVDDTPLQSVATSGCPVTQDSCPSADGYDSIHNYMDYSFDRCTVQFTAGQAARMAQMYAIYRNGK